MSTDRCTSTDNHSTCNCKLPSGCPTSPWQLRVTVNSSVKRKRTWLCPTSLHPVDHHSARLVCPGLASRSSRPTKVTRKHHLLPTIMDRCSLLQTPLLQPNFSQLHLPAKITRCHLQRLLCLVLPNRLKKAQLHYQTRRKRLWQRSSYSDLSSGKLVNPDIDSGWKSAG